MEMFSNNIYRHSPPPVQVAVAVRVFLCAHAHRRPLPFCTGKHKTNPPISLNSLNRQALTGIDRCSDGGMWMSHVFSIIYTALLFLSPPLRQVSILLRRNQSVICQPLSIRRLIYVSYCGWLHAKRDTGEENKCWRETLFARRQQVFLGGGISFFPSSSSASRQNSATAESGFIYLFLLEPRPRTAVDRVGGTEVPRGRQSNFWSSLSHERWLTPWNFHNSQKFSSVFLFFFFFVKLQ